MTGRIIEHLVIVGISIKQTSAYLLDRITFREDDEKVDFLNLLTSKGISNPILLSTCNRVEIIFLGNHVTHGPTVIESLRKSKKIDGRVPFYTLVLPLPTEQLLMPSKLSSRTLGSIFFPLKR